MSVINSPSSIEQVDGYVARYRSSIVGISLALGSVTTILIALRIYTYFFIVRRQGGWIILLAIFAWVLGMPATVIDCYTSYNPDFFNSQFLPGVGAAFGWWSVGFAKLGVTLYILQIQGRTNKLGKRILLAAVGMNFICCILNTPLIILKLQTHRVGSRTIMFGSTWSALTDILLAVYPLFIIWKLQMSLQPKIMLSCLMGLGIVGAACGITKAVVIGTRRHTYDVAPLVILTIIELELVQITSAAAPLWPLVKHISAKRASKDVEHASSLIRLKDIGTRQDESQEVLVTPGRILLTNHLSVQRERV